MTYVAKTYKDGKLYEAFFKASGQDNIRKKAMEAMQEQHKIDKVLGWSPVGKADP